MSPPGRRLMALLLAVLWAAGRGRGSESQPRASSDAEFDSEQVLRLIVHAVTAEIRPLVDKLASRIDRLDNRLNGIVDKLDYRLNGIETRIDAIDLKQNSVDDRLHDLVPHVDSSVSKLDARIDEVASLVNTTVTVLGPRLDKLAAESNSSENSLQSRLDELVSNMRRRDKLVDSRLDNLTSTVNSTAILRSRVDELASTAGSSTSDLSFRLDELTARMDSQTAAHVRRLDSVSSRLDELTKLTAPRDCRDLPAGAASGIHMLRPGGNSSQPLVAAYCDFDTDGGGWTVIQRRKDIEPPQSFDLDWSQYKAGFGQVDKEFWWGLENIWRMTGSANRQYQLRVELADYDGGRRYAVYQRFKVASEADGYRLSVGGYTGNAGDSLTIHDGLKFSTKDRDQDTNVDYNCAKGWHGGWWFKKCYRTHLNGPHRYAEDVGSAGIHWNSWRGGRYALKESVMMIRQVGTK